MVYWPGLPATALKTTEYDAVELAELAVYVHVPERSLVKARLVALQPAPASRSRWTSTPEAVFDPVLRTGRPPAGSYQNHAVPMPNEQIPAPDQKATIDSSTTNQVFDALELLFPHILSWKHRLGA